MFPQIPITPNIYYVGVNDRTKDLFESMWPLPHGVSYNSYLVVDEKVTLFDTVDICYAELFLHQIKAVIGDRDIDYLVVNHMEPDHSGSIGMLRRLYPNLKIVGNKKTFGMLQCYFPEIQDNLVTVEEGDTLNTGSCEFTFVMAPMVHWPEVMFTYEKSNKVLFSADAFGTFGTLDGNILDSETNLERYYREMYRYYACIVGKFGPFVQKVLAKVQGLNLPVEYICPLHGPVWTPAHFQEAWTIYDKLSRYEADKGAVILYGSMYGHTTVLADTVARALAQEGVRDVVCHDVSRTHPSVVLRDIFRYRALVVGSPTYSNEIFAPIKNVLDLIRTREVKDRIYGVFGSCTWAGQAVKKLIPFAEEMQWELVGCPVEQKGSAKEEDVCKAVELGTAIGRRLNELYPNQ